MAPKRKSSATHANTSAKRSKTTHHHNVTFYKKPWKGRRGGGYSGSGTRSYGKSGSALDVITNAVARKLSSIPVGPTQKVSLIAGEDIPLKIGHDKQQVTFFPITWAIPTFQPQPFLPDERFRRSNTIFLSGCLVRFMVTFKHTFRIRMVAYTPQTGAGRQDFETAHTIIDPTDPNKKRTILDPNDRPASSFKLNWVTASDPKVVPGGPFHLERVDRQKVDPVTKSTGVWTYDSSDGSLFGAALGKGEMRPLSHFSLVKNVNSSAGTTGGSMTHEVRWWIPIKQDIHFEAETGNVALDGIFQILFYYDVPFVGTLSMSGDTTIGEVSAPVIKVYYK